MGLWRDLLGPKREAVGTLVHGLPSAIASPWSGGNLSRIVLADIAGIGQGIVTRADAMKIPAVARGRGLICGTLSRYPLSVWSYGEAESADVQLPTPRWMTSTNTQQSPRMRTLWTLDDLIFGGLAVWAVEREDDGTILDAIRVQPPYWSVDPDSLGVLVNGSPVSDEEVLVFEGWQDGLLTMANESVNASSNLRNAWMQRVKSPIPLVSIKQTADTQLEGDEIDDLVVDYEAARRDGGTAFVPMGFDIEAMGAGSAPDLYVEGRNAERIDWGNHLGLPAAMLDGSMSTASLTYSTAEGKRNEFIDYSLAAWTMPMEARLSQDDVTADGTFTRFDLKWLTNPVQQGLSPRQED